ncbi:MAG: hypothetical protein LBK13_12620 [Spirochaetales bacterium]|jgi:hypothetical protein|nr:hypothetical protein [Spirochaetales bacterium]
MRGNIFGRILCRFLCCTFFFLFPAFLGADGSYTVESIQFIPPVYYVGDRVELRAVLRSSSGVRILPPKEFPRIEWGEFHDAYIVPRDGLTALHISFTAYQTGSKTIPNLVCGDVVLQGLSASVRSLTEGAVREPAPAHGSLLLPSTRLIIALAAGFLIVLPLAALACFIWLRPGLRKIIGYYREKQPYRKLKKDLALLRVRAGETDSRQFYISLLEAMKLYMNRHIAANCLAFTTRELEAVFGKTFECGQEADALLGIFRYGDEVKFGGRESSQGKRLQDISLGAAILWRLENSRRAAKKESVHA